MSLVHTESPMELFQELVEQAMDRQQVESSTESAFYLVQLLDGFVFPDRLYRRAEVDPEQPLAEILCAAATSDGMRKFTLLKFSGDLSLFLSGFFPDSLSRGLVDVDYYGQLGGSAYAAVASSRHARGSAILFEELALKFGQFVDVLNEVSENCAMTDDSNILRLYERYQRTGSQRCARILHQQSVPVVQQGSLEIN